MSREAGRDAPSTGIESRSVRVEKRGPVTTVILDRPHTRNAVDRATAAALADAFRPFEADPEAAVAVLTGAGRSRTPVTRSSNPGPEYRNPVGPFTEKADE